MGALALTASCDVPTGIPHWQETWNLPAKATTISVASLLPAGVAVMPDSSAFRVDVAPTSATRRLGQDCSDCAAANGTTAPKPAFSMTIADSSALPGGLASATLAGDTLTVTIANGLDFDPLRPSATAAGRLLLTVLSGTTTLARDSVDGATTAIPAGGTLVRRIPLSGTLSGADGIRIAATLDSPAGDPVLIDSSETVTVTASTGNLLVSNAQVKVQNQDVSAVPLSLDFSGIGNSVSSRVQSGTLDLAITNPFTVQGPATLYFTGTASSGQKIALTKTLLLPSAASSTASVSFATTEVQQLLGAKVSLQLGAVLSAPSGLVTVTPRQAVGLSTRFEIVVNTESGQ